MYPLFGTADGKNGSCRLKRGFFAAVFPDRGAVHSHKLPCKWSVAVGLRGIDKVLGYRLRGGESGMNVGCQACL